MKNRSSSLSLLLGVAVLVPAFVGTGCSYLSDDCELMRNCEHFLDDDGAEAGAPGDGDGDTGGKPGDGDGDGDTGGKGGDGDGDGDSGGTGGGDGDGDGDTGGNGSGGAAEPCDGACEGSAPLCDEETEMCVQCLDEGDCSEVEGKPACRIDHSCVECVATPDCRDAEKPVCDGAKNECVECFAPEHCGTEKPVCDPSDGTCVGCLGDDDCATGVCDTSEDVQSCVQCLVDSDCGDPALARCSADNECVGCTESPQCERFDGSDSRAVTTVCDKVAAECVNCTVAEDFRDIDTDACGAGICQPDTQTCHEMLVQATTTTCRSCIADNQCVVGHDCVPMEYEGLNRGGYCLKISPGCIQPYRIPMPMLKTLSGKTGETYCGINEGLTTCEAVRALVGNDPCVEDSDCPEGGLCRTVGGGSPKNCTYECSLTLQCPVDSPLDTCGEGDGSTAEPTNPLYCGGYVPPE